VRADLIGAAKYYELAANHGSPPAENSLGICHLFGHGVEQNAAMAAKRFESASDHGNVDGSNHYGLCLEFGEGVKTDLALAAQYYLKAANSGHAEAQYHLGFCLEHGFGVEVDFCEASKYYRLSGDQGHIGGLRSSARFLHYGLGGEEDLELAAEYYEKSSNSSPTSIDDHHFRCLRSLNRGSIRDLQFSDLSTVRLRVFSECQSARPVRPGQLSEYIITRPTSVSKTVIGHGGSSTVFLVKDSNGFGTYVIKYFDTDISESEFIREIEILVKLNHPCILRIFHFVLPSDSMQAEIHMEWAQNGSLARILRQAKGTQCPSFWTPTGISIIICGIVLGMSFMHSRGFIHQDLKPSNILLDDKGRVLIGDFGASRSQSADITPMPGGTVHYAAPEMGREVDWTQKVDVYSFGLILYEILVGSPVFGEDQPPFEVLRSQRADVMPSIGPSVLPPMKDLIEACWRSNPVDRPSFDAILETLENGDYAILPGADQQTVCDYVRGVEDWERTHALLVPPFDPDSLLLKNV
jgi:hypothetical protein